MSSELQVNTITEATSGSGITFAKDVIPATPLSHRNMIINGGMQVAQRATALTQVTNADYKTLDRWKFWENTDGTYQTKQNAVTDLAGFTNSLYLSPNGADTSIAAGQYAFFAQLIEAQNLQPLAYGTANAKTMTLSFYIKSNLTGKMTAYVAKYDNTVRIVPLEFDLPSSAGTWERITLTVPALTETAAGVINNDNGMGLEIGWYMSAGSTYKVGTSGTWGSNANGYSTTNHNINFMSSTSNYIEITGVQLELGSVATPFEHRSFGDEILRCQRYFSKSGPYATAPAQASDTKTVTTSIDMAGDLMRTPYIYFPINMRTAPTVTLLKEGALQYGVNGSWAWYEQGSWQTTTFAPSGVTEIGYAAHTNDAGSSDGRAYYMHINWTASAEL